MDNLAGGTLACESPHGRADWRYVGKAKPVIVGSGASLGCDRREGRSLEGTW